MVFFRVQSIFTDFEVSTYRFAPHLVAVLGDQTANSLKKNLMLGKMEGRKRKEQQKYLRWLDGIIDSMNMSLSELQFFMIRVRPVL